MTSPEASAAEELAQALPHARVVKAFNTTFSGTLVAGEAAGQQLDVFLASDDDDAKRTAPNSSKRARCDWSTSGRCAVPASWSSSDFCT